jgi:hypothetical protein
LSRRRFNDLEQILDPDKFGSPDLGIGGRSICLQSCDLFAQQFLRESELVAEGLEGDSETHLVSSACRRDDVCQRMALRRGFKRLAVPVIETRGFYPYESRSDVISLIGSDTEGALLTPQIMDAVLHSHTMLPTGRWLFKFENQQDYSRAIHHINATSKDIPRLRYRCRYFLCVSSLTSVRYITEETKLFEFQTTSKFGIDSQTMLAYDIPPTVDAEELNYALEGFGLDQRGIRRVVADKSSISFLIHFSSRGEAERAVFQLNGSSFAGANMHLHLYS